MSDVPGVTTLTATATMTDIVDAHDMVTAGLSDIQRQADAIELEDLATLDGRDKLRQYLDELIESSEQLNNDALDLAIAIGAVFRADFDDNDA